MIEIIDNRQPETPITKSDMLGVAHLKGKNLLGFDYDFIRLTLSTGYSIEIDKNDFDIVRAHIPISNDV